MERPWKNRNGPEHATTSATLQPTQHPETMQIHVLTYLRGNFKINLLIPLIPSRIRYVVTLLSKRYSSHGEFCYCTALYCPVLRCAVFNDGSSEASFCIACLTTPIACIRASFSFNAWLMHHPVSWTAPLLISANRLHGICPVDLPSTTSNFRQSATPFSSLPSPSVLSPFCFLMRIKDLPCPITVWFGAAPHK
jgi:hypothetical protein